MKKETFKYNDLIICDWQYTIKWDTPSKFGYGEKVFLKSNPECPMMVYTINKKTVTTTWKDNDGIIQYHDFIPEIILQYKYASLMIGKRKYHICLN